MELITVSSACAQQDDPLKAAKDYMSQRQPQKAAAYLEQYLKIGKNKENSQAHDLLARAYYRLAEEEKSDKEFTEAIKYHPNDGIYYQDRASFYLHTDQFDKVIPDAQAALSKGSNPIVAYGQLADAYFALSQYKQASLYSAKEIELLQKSRKPNDSFLQHACIRLGRAYMKLGNYSKAIAEFSKVLSTGPRLSVNVDRAECYSKTGRYKEAVADLTAAIGIEPTRPTFYTNRAALYDKLGRSDLAKEDRKTVKQITEELMPRRKPGW